MEAITAPTGLIPKYEDLAPLFKQLLNKEYSHDDYVEQFTIRVPENLAKIERVEKFHREHVPGSPAVVFEVLDEQRDRLTKLQEQKGDYVSPLDL